MAASVEEAFSGTFENILEETPLEESSLDCSDEEQMCPICNCKLNNPRLLSCLHVFCEECLRKMAEEMPKDKVIVCPNCQQETKLGRKGVAGLACDYISVNIQDMLAITSKLVVCTSCKTNAEAVARCSDCANFLCPNCNTAHQFMRCFEDHKVVSFEDLKKSTETVPIHKPVFCDNHPSETLKFFCYTCLVPICNECVVVDHTAPEHHCERLSEAFERQKKELQNLVTESKSKLVFCEEAASSLTNALSELQSQHDNAKGLIDETYQSYKAFLEKRKDELLEELKSLHAEHRLRLMENCHSVEKTMEQIEDACKFTTRLLDFGSAVEVLYLRKIIGIQLLNLINNTPKPDVNTSLEFVTDAEKFQSTLQTSFGNFRKMESPAVTATTTPQQESPPPPLSIVAGPVIPCPPSSVTSSPVSMPSSFEGELTFPNTALPLPLTTIQEYNLNQLASLAEKDITTQSSNPSPTPSFTLADLFSGDYSSTSNALNNLQALAKLGSVSLNDQGEYQMNGTSYPMNILSSPNPVIKSARTAICNAIYNDMVNGAINGAAAVAPLLGRGSPIDALNQQIPPSINGIIYPRSSPTAPQASILPNSASNMSGSAVSINYNHPPVPRASGNKASQMHIRYRFGTLGSSKSQFNSPHGFCLGSDEDIIVADTNNHRIQIFEKNGDFKFQFGVSGKEEGQLWYPRKVAVMKATGKFVVCDRGNERSRMQIFTKNGHFVKKIAIRSDEWWNKLLECGIPVKPRYIDIVAGLAVSSQGHIVAVDSVSPTVFTISDTGDLLNWFDCSGHMREPSDLAINGKEYFVCDFKGHCVVVFNETGTFLRRIGCENITNFPNGIDISDAGDVLVGDSHGNKFHVAVFNREGQILCEFECPYVKVSRCCGLKITSEGFIVTLAKNNHHVLVLNTLYIV